MSHREQAQLTRWTVRAVLLIGAAAGVGLLVGQSLVPAATPGCSSDPA